MPFSPVLGILVYVAGISLLSVIVTVSDKQFAIHHVRRVSEFTLLTIAALGGSAAMYFTMLFIRHKTRKPKFMVGIPVIMLLQLLGVVTIVWLLTTLH
jgi:uncharacterized membrane protein YsdA (DUF1294 family)